MHFVSLAEFYKDIAAWERSLPEVDAVVGIPRSGLIPAAYIALRRNIRLVDLAELIKAPDSAVGDAKVRDSNPLSRLSAGNRVLVVDDSASDDSVTTQLIRKKLQDQTALNIQYGVVYRASVRSQVDYYYREVQMPRLFEWNWFRNWRIAGSLLDMDGVLCEDWPNRPERDVDPQFQDHLANVRPLYIPQVPCRAVVTSRIERYRKQTEAWLSRHNVLYEQLIMHPAATPEARQAAGDHAARKAAAYIASPAAPLFIESCVKQAQEIAAIAKRPVLCIDTMTMYGGHA
jgi:uncharacterized HAD superfamily protein/hypoxanthine phosphoribosyltransferase